ncbi:transcriptional regulator [Bacillus tianshenii]|nr:transcriptional regulator [Bacillus tianshenii]
MRKVLQYCLEEGIVCELIYQSDADLFTKRRIKVHEVTDDYVRGYCYLRKATRTFKMKNILSCAPFSS